MMLCSLLQCEIMNDYVMYTAMIMYYNVRQNVGRKTEVIINKKDQEITKRETC